MAMAMGMASATLLGFPQVNPNSSSSVHLSFSKSTTLGATSLSLSPSPTPSLSISSPLYIICGRGDKKTARGKRFKHSYGNARPRNKNKGRGPQRVPVPPAPPRKDKFDDGEITPVEIDDSLFTKAEERVIEAAAKAGYSSVTEYNESPIRHYYCYGCGERRAESAVEKCRLCKREEKLSEQEAEKQAKARRVGMSVWETPFIQIQAWKMGI